MPRPAYDRRSPIGPMLWQQWPYHLKFNKPRHWALRPVRGGRWSVRKTMVPKTRQWKAWCLGTAKHWSRWFRTFDEAIAHAQLVAACYAEYDKELADKMIRTQMMRLNYRRNVINITERRDQRHGDSISRVRFR